MSASSPSSRPFVLLVEDEPIVREIVALELQEAGFNVIGASTGEEAADRLCAGEIIDLVFTDVNLPGAIDGWRVAELARAQRPDFPVIYATGSYDDDHVRRVPDSIILSKPYRTADVVAAAAALGVPIG